jgi:hypothetical protein
MAHLIDETTGPAAVFVVGTPAWPQLGTGIAQAATSAEALPLAVLDGLAQPPPVDLADGSQVPGRVANVRTDTGAVRGVVGQGYQVFQDRQAFDFMFALVGDQLARFETAGSLDGGPHVGRRARIPKELRAARDDLVKPYVLLSNGHDGPKALKMIPTSVRLVCNNTLNLALCQGRKVWVYVQFTDKRDVQGRLEKLLQKARLKVKALRSSVTLAKREEWIAKHAPGTDVVISHPRLVEMGLDLFDKAGKYNFPTLVFYETGYNLFTLRQAARRAWRIGQRAGCRAFYFYYKDTMQERAMSLMGKKLVAAQALEGKFSEEGLLALADGDDGVEVALAKSLANRIREGSTQRVRGKVGGPAPRARQGKAARCPDHRVYRRGSPRQSP